MMLDTRIYVFKAVADQKSFTLAAQQLYMTQSAVSHHIAGLESHYGLKLFDRMHRKIALTLAGEKLYGYASEIERLCQEAEKEMRGLSSSVSGRLHIGASLTIGEYVLPELLARFNQLYPSVDITMDIFNSDQIAHKVIEGKVDAGFIEGKLELAGTIEQHECGGDELVIIAPVKGAAAAGVVSIETLMDQRWIMREATSGTRTSFESFLRTHGVEPSALNVGMELGSTQAIKEAVKVDLGIAPISSLAVAEEVARGEFQLLALAEGPMKRSFSLITNPDKFQTFTTEKFLQFIFQQLRA